MYAEIAAKAIKIYSIHPSHLLTQAKAKLFKTRQNYTMHSGKIQVSIMQFKTAMIIHLFISWSRVEYASRCTRDVH